MKTFRLCLALATAACAAAAHAAADAYPSRPVRVVVPYAAGGAELQIRPLLPALERALGQPVIVENVGGAGGMIGANTVKAARADGHTLLYTASAVLTVAPKLNKASYARSDFAPVCNVIGIPFLVASRQGSALTSVPALTAAARKAPGALTFGSAGQGTATHLAGEAIAFALHTRITHVPFQGMAPATVSLIGGNIDFVVGAPGVVMPQVRSGKLLALATTGAERFDATPDVPTLREAGVEVNEVTRYGFYAPAGTPPEAIRRFSAAVAQAVREAGYVQSMRASFNGIAYLDGPALGAVLAKEDAYYDGLLRQLDLGANK